MKSVHVALQSYYSFQSICMCIEVTLKCWPSSVYWLTAAHSIFNTDEKGQKTIQTATKSRMIQNINLLTNMQRIAFIAISGLLFLLSLMNTTVKIGLGSMQERSIKLLH